MLAANCNQIPVSSGITSRKNSFDNDTAKYLIDDRSDHSVSKQPPQSNVIPFPWKLHRILDDADSKGFNDIVSWVPSENGFKVYKTKVFDEEIMPKYFDKTKYKSFQRQLNMWGFDRVGSGPYKGAYLHTCFIRGKPQLCESMQRTKIKGIHSKKLRKSLLTNMDLLGGGSNHSLGEESSHSLGRGSSHSLGRGSSQSLNRGSSQSLGRGSSQSLNRGSSHSLGRGSSQSLGRGSSQSLGRGSNHSTSSSASSSSLSTMDVHASIKAAAQKVADLERQKEEIQRKLELVSTKANAAAVSDSLINMTPVQSSNNMITPHSSSHSREQQDERSSSFQPLPMGEGDSLLFGGRNFFFVEDGKISQQQQQQQQQPLHQQEPQRRRASRRFSLEPKGLDSDEYVLKELDDNFFGEHTSGGSSSNNSDSQLEENMKHALGRICGGNTANLRSCAETDSSIMVPTPLPPDMDVVTATTDIGYHNSSLIIGLDRPSRRFSFLSTPVQNPFDNKPHQMEHKPSFSSSREMASSNFNLKLANNSNIINNNINNINNRRTNLNMMTNNMMKMNMLTGMNMNMGMNMNTNDQNSSDANNLNNRRNSLMNLLKIPSRPSFSSF